MTPQHALLFLGLFAIGAVALCFGALAWMHFTITRAERRERALPRLAKRPPAPGNPYPVSSFFRQGKVSPDQAEAASNGTEVRG